MLVSRTGDPLILIIEECNKDNPKLQHNHIIWGTPLLTEQMGMMFISDGIYLFHTYRCGKYKWTNTSYILASCATTKKAKQTSVLKIVNLKMK